MVQVRKVHLKMEEEKEEEVEKGEKDKEEETVLNNCSCL